MSGIEETFGGGSLEAAYSLSKWLGRTDGAGGVWAMNDAEIRAAIEKRTEELAAEKRAACDCGCQASRFADPLVADAYMRRRLVPGGSS